MLFIPASASATQAVITTHTSVPRLQQLPGPHIIQMHTSRRNLKRAQKTYQLRRKKEQRKKSISTSTVTVEKTSDALSSGGPPPPVVQWSNPSMLHTDAPQVPSAGKPPRTLCIPPV